ncbi:ABC transporter ATP-binding protein [Defluviimonas sp. WL0002]|uniref:ABC transporter ATP-binding protein n=1 Tax=Albidovulum marisflavi TaxID=2984159 RepID=A0ABT2ZEP8_9RHOB|nr:ABC transporter ATP-binding protein [Defluviimonas sp. WL0002]MCV2869615.1 ABC transporter ATP-binding protein [Defluviimonas sp. WL0002]
MSGCALSIRNLSVHANGRPVLLGIDFDLSSHGMTALMGPMGSGKSAFLKCICSSDSDLLEVRWDEAVYRGARLERDRRPVLIRQKPRQDARKAKASGRLLDERIEEISQACAGNRDVLCIDEPTAGLNARDGAGMMRFLQAHAQARPILLVSHNSKEVRGFCDRVALLGGGRMIAHCPKAEFFAPGAGRHVEWFIRTGGLDLPGAGTPRHMLSSEHRPLPPEFDRTAVRPGVDRAWIIEHALELRWPVAEGGGNPRPNPDDGHMIVSVGRDATTLAGPGGRRAVQLWDHDHTRPDLDMPAILNICRLVEEAISEGLLVMIEPRENVVGTAAILGSFMVMRGAAPEDAVRLASAKLPELHFGMRMEQLFWDIDTGLTI